MRINRCLLPLKPLVFMVLLPVFYFLAAPSSAKGLAKELEEINSDCKGIDQDIKNNNAIAFQYLAVLSPGIPEKWQAFKTENDLLAACPKGCYRKAEVVHRSETPVFVLCEFKSPSKEWVQYIKYYFRADGTLEKIHYDLRKFGAYEKSKGMEQQFLVKVLRDCFYDSKGKCIKKSHPRCFNTSTGKEIEDVVFKDESCPLYIDIGKLPFYNLLYKI